MSTVKSRDGTTIAYERSGDGPPLVIVDGALCRRTFGPGAPLVMMRLMPVWSKLKEVAHTLPYDHHVVEPGRHRRPLPADRWTSVTMPVLTMAGSKSDAWMGNAQQAVADVLPDARYRTLDGQTHLLKPEAVAPVLKEFFPG